MTDISSKLNNQALHGIGPDLVLGPSPDERPTFAWLIEAPGQNYLAVRELARRKEFHWTADHNKALRFHTEQQADDLMMAVRELDRELFGFAITLGDAKPVEHGWSAARQLEETAKFMADNGL